MQHLPTHPTLTHPHTGDPLQAIGFGRRGPIWPIIGASEDDQTPDPGNEPPEDPKEPEAGDPPKSDDEELGDSGKKALTAERDARKAAEKRAADAEKRIKEFEDAKKTDSEKASEAQQELEKAARTNAEKALRYEVAEKAGLPLSAAKRLSGGNEKELLEDAEELKKLLGSLESKEPKSPKADPSQGSGGGKPTPKNLNDAIAGHYDT